MSSFVGPDYSPLTPLLYKISVNNGIYNEYLTRNELLLTFRSGS